MEQPPQPRNLRQVVGIVGGRVRVHEPTPTLTRHPPATRTSKAEDLTLFVDAEGYLLVLSDEQIANLNDNEHDEQAPTSPAPNDGPDPDPDEAHPGPGPTTLLNNQTPTPTIKTQPTAPIPHGSLYQQTRFSV